MSDFGQALLQSISQRFNENIRKDKKIREIAKRVQNSTEYLDASEYASRLGELLSEAINEETGELAYMSEEVASELLYPLLSGDHDMACEAIQAVQQNMYDELGAGLNVALPELDTNRINGLVGKISGYTSFEDARWLVNEPIVNFSMAVVDQAIRDNAKRASSVGLTAKLVRKAEPSGVKSRKIGRKTYSYRVPCRWCSNLTGTWKYENAPADIYRRHAFCRCTVTYHLGGTAESVWSKKMWSEDDANARREQIQEAEQRAVEDRTRMDVRKVVSSLRVNHQQARRILIDYHDDIARDGLEAVMGKLRQNQNLLNKKYR